MNPGKLNKRISFITSGESTGAWGNNDGDIFKTVWASIRHLRGREFYQAAQVQAESTTIFNCRYFNGIDQSMKIKYKEKVYDIKSINNINERNVEYEIHAIKVISSV